MFSKLVGILCLVAKIVSSCNILFPQAGAWVTLLANILLSLFFSTLDANRQCPTRPGSVLCWTPVRSRSKSRSRSRSMEQEQEQEMITYCTGFCNVSLLFRLWLWSWQYLLCASWRGEKRLPLLILNKIVIVLK